MEHIYYYDIKDNTLTIYNNKGMSVATISDVERTDYEYILWLVTDVLYGMNYIKLEEKITLYPY